MNRLHLLLLSLALPCVLLSSCSSNPVAASDAGSDAGTGAGTDAGSSDAGDGGSCLPRATYGGGEVNTQEGSVTAFIVDEIGAPIAGGQPVYICGLNLCSAPSTTSDAGTASITTNLSMKRPAFKYGDAINYAEFAIPLTSGSTDFTANGTGTLGTGKLSDKPGAALTPGTSAISGDVTVALAADAIVGIDTLTYSTADQQKFRAVNIPLTNLAPVLGNVTVSGAAANFALVYGVAPAETTLCPPAQISVSLPQTLRWAAGAAVEFWITTSDVSQTYAPYGGWAWMSDGVVSPDGKRVTSTQGFNLLENFAIRLK